MSVCTSSGGCIVIYLTVRGVGEKLLQYPSTYCGKLSAQAIRQKALLLEEYLPTSCTIDTKGSLERTAATQYI